MNGDQPKTLSDKIEETIEGALRFALRFSSTILVILLWPVSADRTLARADHRKKKYLRPLTFLAIGGFVFSVTISVYPKGFLGLINIIWFDEEINETILKRWQEALSITGLVVAAFPVLLTVSGIAALIGRLALPKAQRKDFFGLSCYLFGYQSFLLFSFFFFAIGVNVVRALVGVEVKEVLGIENADVNLPIQQILYVVLIGLFLSALLMPTVGLSLWALRSLRTRPIWLKFGAVAAVAVYCIVTLAIYSYTASAPAAFAEIATPKAAGIEIHFLEDPIVKVEPDRTTDSPRADFDLNIAIENAPTAHLIARRNDITVGIVAEFENAEDQLWSSRDFTVVADNQQVQMILVEKDGLRAYRLAGTIPLTEEVIDLIQRKVLRPFDTNHYGFFINIRLQQGSNETDRRLYLYADDLMPGLSAN